MIKLSTIEKGVSMNLEVFKNSGFELRGGLINGEPYFVAMDIAKALGYVDAYSMTRRLDDDEVQNHQVSGFGNRGINLINESGLYNAILGSDKDEAKQFKKWVTSEVLPSIRKNGMYATAPTLENMINNPDFAISLLTKLKEEQELRRIEKEKNQKLVMQIEEDKPKIIFADAVSSTDTDLLIRDWAKTIGVQEKACRKWLIDKKLMFDANKNKENGKNAKYRASAYGISSGYIKQTETPIIHPNPSFSNRIGITVRITSKGQLQLTDKILKDLCLECNKNNNNLSKS